jgi:16S rRNA (adenine1518-N6/adenine1519-N6)-dimethyltransferase
VVAVELDTAIIPALCAVLSPFNNVEVVEGDILELDPSELVKGEPYIVAANIPYYITSAVIRHLLDVKTGPGLVASPARPKRIALTVQKEVGQRICAQAGDLSLLALSVQVFGTASVVAQIPSSAFYPAPEVDSVVVRIDLYPQPFIPAESLDRFFLLARAGFSQKRKKLRNSLSGGLHISPDEAVKRLEQAGIDPGRRAETLALEEWKRLVFSLD